MVCFIVKGPAKLPAERRDAVIAQAQKAIAWVKKGLALRERDEGDTGVPDVDEWAAFWDGQPTCLGPHSDLVEVERLEDIDAEEFVDEFMASWPPATRGSGWRADPDDPKQVIVVAGDPESEGFQLFSVAQDLGILAIFGIK